MFKEMFESRISAAATQTLLVKDTRKKYVEIFLELAKKEDRAVVQSLNSLLG